MKVKSQTLRPPSDLSGEVRSFVSNMRPLTQLPKVGPTAFAVYCVLAKHASSDAQACWPSIDTIASATGRSASTVRHACKKLVLEQLIHAEEADI